MPVYNFTDFGGASVAVRTPEALGRVAAALSAGVVLSNEDLAAINAITTAVTLLTTGVARGVLVPQTSITRPANTTAYSATAPGDAYADAAAIAGGFVLANAVAASGKSCRLSHLEIVDSAIPTGSNPPLQGEIHLFNGAITSIADNAAWSVSDADMLKRISVIPFNMSILGANQSAHVPVGEDLLAVGSTNFNFLVRVTNAYVPVSGEILTVSAFCAGLN